MKKCIYFGEIERNGRDARLTLKVSDRYGKNVVVEHNSWYSSLCKAKAAARTLCYDHDIDPCFTEDPYGYTVLVTGSSK